MRGLRGTLAWPTSRGDRGNRLWIGGLLLLRLSLVVPWFHASELWTWAVFPTLTYLATLYLLLLNRGDLARYRIDRLAYLVICFAGPFQFIFCLKSQQKLPAIVAGSVSTAAAIAFTVTAFRYRLVPSGGTRKELVSIPFGIAAGLAIAIVLNAPAILHLQPTGSGESFARLLLGIAAAFSVQLFTAGPLEEPLFRGYVLGELERLRLKPLAAVAIQAALFTLAHLYFFPRPELYLLAPVCGMVFGVLALARSSISASMFAHATVNASIYTLVPLIASVM